MTSPVLLVALVYGAAALAANWPSWPGNPTDMRQGDLTFAVWAMEWIPQSLLHGHNPFFTDYLNYPAGANLADNTGLPLLAFLLIPVTLIFGSISSLNLLLWLAYTLSALSMFGVLRLFRVPAAAAFVGGLIYGFSPYMVGQGLSHLNLIFVPLPPVIFYATYRALDASESRPLYRGGILATLVLAQYYIAPEVLTDTAVILITALVLLVVRYPRVALQRLWHIGKVLAVVLPIVIVGAVYPTWMALVGREHTSGSLGGGISADLYGAFVPTSFQRFAPAVVTNYGNHLVLSDTPENGSYLSIPLVLLAVFFAIYYRRRKWIKLAAMMALAAWILSLGPLLVVGNHITKIRLPAWVLWNSPVLHQIAEVRLTLYVDLFVAAVVALGLGYRIEDRGNNASMRARTTRGRIASLVLIVVLGLSGIVMLFPRWPYLVGPSGTPAFFTSTALKRIPPGSVALISPYPSVSAVAPEVWQAEAGMRFKMIGGYVLLPNGQGGTTPYPDVLTPIDVPGFLWAEGFGGPPWPPQTLPTSPAVLKHDLRVFLKRYHVDTIISTGAVTYPTSVNDYFIQALGQPTYTGGTVLAWFHVQRIVDS